MIGRLWGSFLLSVRAIIVMSQMSVSGRVAVRFQQQRSWGKQNRGVCGR